MSAVPDFACEQNNVCQEIASAEYPKGLYRWQEGFRSHAPSRDLKGQNTVIITRDHAT